MASRKQVRPKSLPDGYAFNMGGGAVNYQLVARSVQGFDREMKSLGYPQLSNAEISRRLANVATRPKAFIVKGGLRAGILPPAYLQIIAILSDPITIGLVEAAAGHFFSIAFPWFRKLLPSGKKTQKGITKRPDAPKFIELPFQWRPTMWFGAEEVLVTVIVHIDEPSDFRTAEPLIAQAFVQAAEWLESHGRTHPYLTYRIKNGKINNFPTLSGDEPPPA